MNIGRITFSPHRAHTTGDFDCLVCGQSGGHGNLPCPKLEFGPSPTPVYAPNPSPLPIGARPTDFGEKLDRIIELLEQLIEREP
jgi:hypothetical protein